MTVEKIGFEQFGGTVAEGGLDTLLAPQTVEEARQDRIDLLDLERAEHEASVERPYFI